MTQAVVLQQTSNDQLAADLAGIASGDERSLGRLYDATVDQVFNLARSIVRDPDEAEEVVFDTFSQIWRTADRYSPERGSPRAWITVMTRSRALDRLRRRAASAGQVDLSAIDEPEAEGPGPDHLLDLLNRGSAVHRALTSLTEIQRQVVSLAYFRDLSYTEVATRLGLPLGTVKSHGFRALKTLRQVLSQSE
ncbi:MAG: sigma-70 family RNA polymerase sigma factor [Xanthomonadales bacterium]|nr:sigma-70 family RNA polymerase sigma factor [Xanthomonadales bacterium]